MKHQIPISEFIIRLREEGILTMWQGDPDLLIRIFNTIHVAAARTVFSFARALLFSLILSQKPKKPARLPIWRCVRLTKAKT